MLVSIVHMLLELQWAKGHHHCINQTQLLLRKGLSLHHRGEELNDTDQSVLMQRPHWAAFPLSAVAYS